MKTSRVHNERGIALILTLTILAIVVILLIAFITSMRTERMAAKGFTDYAKARLLADGAIDEAVAVLRMGTPLQTNNPPTTFWTAPGLALTNQNGVFGTVPLYSLNSATAVVNLNAIVNGTITNYVITGTNSVIAAANSGIYAEWINVGANGLPPSAVNPIVGRFAYWIDDEATKVNINSAWKRSTVGGQVTSTNNSLLSEVDLRALEGDFFGNDAVVDGAKTERSTPPAQPVFATPEEVRRSGGGALVFPGTSFSNRFYLTTYSVDTNLDTWGRPRIDLNTITDPTPAGNAYARLNDNIYRNIYPFLNPGSDTFVGKYGPGNVQQILANIIDYTKARTVDATFGDPPNTLNFLEIPSTYCGLKKGPFLNEIIFHVMHTNVINSVVNVGGLDITNWNVTVTVLADVELVNPFSEPLGNNWEVLVEPLSIQYNIFQGSLVTPNDVGPRSGLLTSTFTNWYPTVAGSSVTVTAPLGAPAYRTNVFTANVPPYSYRQAADPIGSGLPTSNWRLVPLWISSTPFDGSGTIANEAPGVRNIAIQMKRVTLRQTPGTASSIRDWATSVGPSGRSDFPAGGSVVPFSLLWDISPINSSPNADAPIEHWLTTSVPGNASFDTNALGIAKNDPRMRTFENVPLLGTVTNWIPTFIFANSGGGAFRVTPGVQNAGGIFEHKTQVFVGALLPDGSERAAIPNPEDGLASTFYIKEAPFETPGELGFIHTGLPWRTLRMQSVFPPTNSVIASAAANPLIPATEVGSIPDWVLLDIFTAGANPQMPGRININATIFGSNDFARPTVAAPGIVHPRTPSMAALFFGMDTAPLSYIMPTVATATNWWGQYSDPVTFAPRSPSQPSSITVAADTNAMFVAWSHDTTLPPVVHNQYFSTNAIAVPAYRYDTNTLFLTPGEICEVAGIDNALVSWGSPREGPRKADKELMVRKIANLITTRSNAFTIWATAQSIKDVNNNGVYDAGTDLILGEVHVQAVVERYVDTTTVPPAVRFRTRYFRYIYE